LTVGTTMTDAFVRHHQAQLQQLNIPPALFATLQQQLEDVFVVHSNASTNADRKDNTPGSSFHPSHWIGHDPLSETYRTEYGSMVVIPHVCSWNMTANSDPSPDNSSRFHHHHPSRGLWDALDTLPDEVLLAVDQGLTALWTEDSFRGACHNNGNGDYDATAVRGDPAAVRQDLLNRLCDDRVWSRIVLYRQPGSHNTIRAALPAPPYYPQCEQPEQAEADLTGPFPFQYHVQHGSERQVIDTFLGYVSPEYWNQRSIDTAHESPNIRTRLVCRLPTVDLVPAYACSDPLTRAVRYVALLGREKASGPHITMVKQHYASFVRNLHFVRQQQLQQQLQQQADKLVEYQQQNQLKLSLQSASTTPSAKSHLCFQSDCNSVEHKVYKVYTDTNDPMELGHPEAGLSPQHYVLTNSIDDADIIFSYKSLFAAGALQEAVERKRDNGQQFFINQFPYEGAFVQKDHLARELLNQHGLPRPVWSMETFDLDVQLAAFVGAHYMATERGERPTWIVKPARGTQSKGHLVTTSSAQVLRLVDAGGESRVVQRYLENSVTYDGRKIDCRCIVLLTEATPGQPCLYIHNRVYFRIAHKSHSISTPRDRMDPESVLTATHLLDSEARSTDDDIHILPFDTKTIAKLEQDYTAFDWKDCIWPKIQVMVRELFDGMTRGFPTMAESPNSRAVYGVDCMFAIDSQEIDDGLTSQSVPKIEPMLTEVTFCPANNAVCDAYERDDNLYRAYNTEVFDCLFRNVVSSNFTPLKTIQEDGTNADLCRN
jgi:hypothetical protein